jgi:hypothetical protein
MWLYSDPNQVQSIIPDRIAKQIPYSVHHIQYRDLDEIRPYLNVPVGLKETNVETPTIAETHVSKYTPNFAKPQYKYPTVFRVMADVQYDIYHLYACGPADHTGNPFVYYDVAYVPNYEKSVFLNGLFRNIRENQNLDYIEESDDEADFEDTRLDKYVDLTKEVWMECVFLPKFRRWVPVRVVDRREKVVHIHKLTQETYGSKGAAPLRSSRCHQKSSGRISRPNPSLNENTHNGRYMNNYKGNHKRNYKGHISQGKGSGFQGKGSVWKSSGRISDDRRFPE